MLIMIPPVYVSTINILIQHNDIENLNIRKISVIDQQKEASIVGFSVE